MERVEQEIKVEVNIVHYSTNTLCYRHSISGTLQVLLCIMHDSILIWYKYISLGNHR